MGKLALKDRGVVVTGASSGLGRALAWRLAVREGAHLWLCARREDRLRELREEILSRADVRVNIMRCDLAEIEDRRRLVRIMADDSGITGLINNAGVTRYGPMIHDDLDVYRNMLEVNLVAVMELSLGFLEVLRGREAGFLLNVTSEAAFVPTPYQGIYAVTKHGIQALTDALRMENRNRPEYIGTFVPGGIRTDMITLSGLDSRVPRDSWLNMTPEKAASACLRGLKRRRPVIIPGLLNRVNHLVTRLLPRQWVLRAAERLYRFPD